MKRIETAIPVHEDSPAALERALLATEHSLATKRMGIAAKHAAYRARLSPRDAPHKEHRVYASSISQLLDKLKEHANARPQLVEAYCLIETP